MKTLIKHVKAVLPTGIIETSILLNGRKIADIDPALQTIVDETVDGGGCYAIPGVVDDQVPLSRARIDAKRRPRPRFTGLCKRGRDQFPGDAQHDPKLHHTTATE